MADRDDRIAQLEAELRQAHNALRCILAYARGPITLPAEWLADADRLQPLMEVHTGPDGAQVWTLEGMPRPAGAIRP